MSSWAVVGAARPLVVVHWREPLCLWPGWEWWKCFQLYLGSRARSWGGSSSLCEHLVYGPWPSAQHAALILKSSNRMAAAPKSFRPHKTAISGQLQGHFLFIFGEQFHSHFSIWPLQFCFLCRFSEFWMQHSEWKNSIFSLQDGELCFSTLWKL